LRERTPGEGRDTKGSDKKGERDGEWREKNEGEWKRTKLHTGSSFISLPAVVII